MNETRQHGTLNDAERLSAVASLGDPVRKRLFGLLRGHPGGLSRDDCANALGLPKSTVRLQLDRMVADKLLGAGFRKVGGRSGPGSGRPTKLYTVAVAEIAASVPARHYDLAAELLAAAMQRSIDTGARPADALAEVAFDAGRAMGAEAGSLAAVLEGTGYDPKPDGSGGTVMENCPFHRLSREHTGVVCHLNGSLLNGVLVGCSDEYHCIEPDADLSHCCARIVPRR